MLSLIVIAVPRSSPKQSTLVISHRSLLLLLLLLLLLACFCRPVLQAAAALLPHAISMAALSHSSSVQDMFRYGSKR